MALTTDPFDATELSAFISETWVPLVNEAFFAKTVFANFCTDLSSYAASGSDIFHLPDVFTNVTIAQTQSTEGAEVMTAAPAATDTTLTVDTHKYVANLIGYKDLVQIAKQYDINAIYTKQAGEVLANELEASLAALWSSLTTNSVGDTATVLSDAEIRQAIEKLATANYDLTECAFFLHPYIFWMQLGAISKYYDQSSFGPASNAGLVATGNFGSASAERALRGNLYGKMYAVLKSFLNNWKLLLYLLVNNSIIPVYV